MNRYIDAEMLLDELNHMLDCDLEEIIALVKSLSCEKVCRNCRYIAENKSLGDFICICEKSEHCADYVCTDDECKYWEATEHD